MSLLELRSEKPTVPKSIHYSGTFNMSVVVVKHYKLGILVVWTFLLEILVCSDDNLNTAILVMLLNIPFAASRTISALQPCFIMTINISIDFGVMGKQFC